jgi:hypothetical protein
MLIGTLSEQRVLNWLPSRERVRDAREPLSDRYSHGIGLYEEDEVKNGTSEKK